MILEERLSLRLERGVTVATAISGGGWPQPPFLNKGWRQLLKILDPTFIFKNREKCKNKKFEQIYSLLGLQTNSLVRQIIQVVGCRFNRPSPIICVRSTAHPPLHRLPCRPHFNRLHSSTSTFLTIGCPALSDRQSHCHRR
jgi:hypothetical protein